MTNIILLNHFYGYPVLMDECSNNLRYAQLLRIIDVFSKRNTIFYCNSFYDEDEKIHAIKQIAMSEGFTWNEYDDEDQLEHIITSLKISPSNSNIIIGGTNTAGCVLRHTNVSIKHWTDLGFSVQLCLSLCADYQMDGISPTDKSHMAQSVVYQFIKDNNIIDKVDLIYNIGDLRRS